MVGSPLQKNCVVSTNNALYLGVFGEATSEQDQLYWVVENSKLLRKCAAIDTVYQVFRGIMSKTW